MLCCWFSLFFFLFFLSHYSLEWVWSLGDFPSWQWRWDICNPTWLPSQGVKMFQYFLFLNCFIFPSYLFLFSVFSHISFVVFRYSWTLPLEIKMPFQLGLSLPYRLLERFLIMESTMNLLLRYFDFFYKSKVQFCQFWIISSISSPDLQVSEINA